MIVVLALVVAVAATAVLLRGNGGGGGVAPLGAGSRAARGGTVATFFQDYVDDSGRVVRHDQGGDTVSEGQAYALLLAAATGDRQRFVQVWKWTKDNLQREDGLLSWQWADGKVVDPEPATDADLDAARALVMAGQSFSDEELVDEAKRLGRAILEHETAEVGGDLVLLAGPWARADRVVNPSYVSPCTYSVLEEATGDDRWSRLRQSGNLLVESLLDQADLPPDWARLDESAAVTATGPPSASDDRPQYGLDAARLAFRLAEDCDGKGPELASRLWSRLEGLEGQGAAVAYSLDGERITPDEHPVGLVGAAAAARSAGATDSSEELLARAAALARRHPTYYGTAWLALGEALLGAPSAGTAAPAQSGGTTR